MAIKSFGEKRKLIRVGKDRPYRGLSKDFSPHMSKVHVSCVDKKSGVILFSCNFIFCRKFFLVPNTEL